MLIKVLTFLIPGFVTSVKKNMDLKFKVGTVVVIKKDLMYVIFAIKDKMEEE